MPLMICNTPEYSSLICLAGHKRSVAVKLGKTRHRARVADIGGLAKWGCRSDVYWAGRTIALLGDNDTHCGHKTGSTTIIAIISQLRRCIVWRPVRPLANNHCLGKHADIRHSALSRLSRSRRQCSA
ncbi:hypothetical protein J6590_073123 [Homalodisca vitripennis]|nr:hypothetical protein J6590_073123 [Homalodisca vitripennis]